jgi:hypothetical protein
MPNSQSTPSPPLAPPPFSYPPPKQPCSHPPQCSSAHSNQLNLTDTATDPETSNSSTPSPTPEAKPHHASKRHRLKSTLQKLLTRFLLPCSCLPSPSKTTSNNPQFLHDNANISDPSADSHQKPPNPKTGAVIIPTAMEETYTEPDDQSLRPQQPRNEFPFPIMPLVTAAAVGTGQSGM